MKAHSLLTQSSNWLRRRALLWLLTLSVTGCQTVTAAIPLPIGFQMRNTQVYLGQFAIRSTSVGLVAIDEQLIVEVERASELRKNGDFQTAIHALIRAREQAGAAKHRGRLVALIDLELGVAYGIWRRSFGYEICI